MKFFTKEVKIATVAIVGIVVLFFGLHFLKGMPVFSTDNVYYASFKDVNGLSASTPIYADGYQVGNVKSIIYNYQKSGNVLVEFQVDNDLRVPKGSTAEIESDMMGNVKMNLIMGAPTAQAVQPGDTISGAVNGGLMDKVAEVAPAVEKMLPKLDSIMASLNTLLADPALAQSLHNVRDITANLTTSTEQLNTLLGNVNRGVPTMMAKANGVLDNTQRLTGNLAALDLAGTMARVDQTLANVQAVTAKLNSNEGTLGLLMNDPNLYHSLNRTVVSADTLLTNLRQHPKRYVHFSLFGKKDK